VLRKPWLILRTRKRVALLVRCWYCTGGPCIRNEHALEIYTKGHASKVSKLSKECVLLENENDSKE
jgi:hypothetical protein